MPITLDMCAIQPSSLLLAVPSPAYQVEDVCHSKPAVELRRHNDAVIAQLQIGFGNGNGNGNIGSGNGNGNTGNNNGNGNIGNNNGNWSTGDNNGNGNIGDNQGNCYATSNNGNYLQADGQWDQERFMKDLYRCMGTQRNSR